MPVYSYRALNKKGKNVKGVVDADNPRQARQKLRTDHLYPVEIQLSDRAGKKNAPAKTRRVFRLKQSRLGFLTDFTRQTATLLEAGLPLVTAMTTIQEQTDDQDFGHILALIREDITSGEAFASALARHPGQFPAEYIHLVRAGEMSGALDQVLLRLADSIELRQNRRSKVLSALTYPILMVLVGSVVLFFLLSFIVPTLTGLFDNLGAALPWPTRLLLAVTGFMENYWWLVLLLLAGGIFIFTRSMKKLENFRRLELILFKLPVVGSLMKKMALARTMRSMAVMTGGGVALPTALDITAQGLGRSVYAQAIDTAGQMVGQGRSLADSLAASGLFPPMARRMVAVGEQSGALPDMLARVAQTYEGETDRTLAALTSLVEPVIILVMGVLVGFIVLAVLLPIFNLSGLVG